MLIFSPEMLISASRHYGQISRSLATSATWPMART
jgi:hypothetical protein